MAKKGGCSLTNQDNSPGIQLAVWGLHLHLEPPIFLQNFEDSNVYAWSVWNHVKSSEEAARLNANYSATPRFAEYRILRIKVKARQKIGAC